MKSVPSPPSPIHGDLLTCHEVWHYNDKRGLATLTGLKIHCSNGDSAVHIGMAAAYGGFDKAIVQLILAAWKLNESRNTPWAIHVAITYVAHMELNSGEWFRTRNL